ncbi:RNA polymerase sigma factor [Planctomycetota bacterium]
MWEDWLLIVRFNRKDGDAFRRIYLKYRSDLLKVAGALLSDQGAAEDVLHDVFMNFARQAGSFRLRSRLKAYLAICVANRARDVNRRERQRRTSGLDAVEEPVSPQPGPAHPLVERERAERLAAALALLPFEQREVIVLHLQQGLRFREIARLQALSPNTVMSRYRYALEKLRSSLNGEL